MAASGFTPISLYYSTTASAVPSSGNLVAGELALNTVDEKLYFKNSAGTVKLLAFNATSAPVLSFSAGTTGFTPSTATTGAITLAGTLNVANGGTGQTTFTAGRILYGNGTSGLNSSASLFFDGTNLGVGTSSPSTYSAKLAVVSTGADTRIAVVDDTTNARGGYLRSNFSDAVILGTTSGVRDLVFSPDNTERMRINTTGNVGIGGAPATKLDVVSSANGINTIRVATTNTDTSTFAAQAYFRVDAGGNHIGGLKSTVRNLSGLSTPSLFLTTAGAYPLAFGINDSSTPSMIVTTTGGLSINTASDPGIGAIYATGAITAFFSDQRLKTVNGKIENALDKVAKLSGVYYTFNDTAKSFGYDSDEVQVGVIAQEVEAVLPQIVKAAPFDLDEHNNSKSGENYKTVQYEKLVPLLIEAINELRAEVTALKGAI